MSENAASDSQDRSESQKPLLPRSAWNSQVAYLRAVFRAKKALDLAEEEAGIGEN
ncbi:MAG: hypothetical protein MUD14_19710 [Hydrococcus sp. Prado102]|jgi:hypothetical protein|nr:hypothetical protein [Hydrococcus sp. Prado102]